MSSPLDHEDFGRLWRAARAARERRGADGDAQLVLASLDSAEARALDGLLGARRRRVVQAGEEFRERLSRLAEAVAATGEDLDAVLARHGGPLADRPAAARSDRAARERVWRELEEHPLMASTAGLREWLERARRGGTLGAIHRDEAARRRLDTALRIVASLPRSPEVQRSALAAEVAGGQPHALDSGTRLERLVRAMLCALRGGVDDGDSSPGAARSLWASFGVQCDPASCTVLTVGLRPAGATPLARALRALAGQHVIVTLGQLEHARLELERGGVCFACENPAVVLAAERALGAACPPLVCVGGWPNSAVHALLERVAEAGAAVRYHGDFDWDGLAIADHLHRLAGATPWRYDAAAYYAAAARLAGSLPALRDARGEAPAGDLATAFAATGLAVPEELVLDDLLNDLRELVAVSASPLAATA